MRVVFDATTLIPGRSGVGYYTEHLLRHLAAEPEISKIHLISNRSVEVSEPLPGSVEIVDRYRMPGRYLWMQALAPRLISELQPDICHFTNSVAPFRSSSPTVLTVHDMSLKLYPDFHPWRRAWIPATISRLAHRVDALVTNTECVKREIVSLLSVDENRVHVVHCAAAPSFRPLEDRALLDEVRGRYNLPRKFVLFVGTIEPRKNLAGLLQATLMLRQRKSVDCHLVLAGAFGWGYKDVASRLKGGDIQNFVHCTGYVPFSDLPAIYNLADAFAYPSFYEGFGLPVVEAMACGVPVACSNCGSLLEVAGNAAEFLDPHSPESICSALEKVLTDSDRRAELVRRGYARAGDFSWSRASRTVVDLYRQLV